MVSGKVDGSLDLGGVSGKGEKWRKILKGEFNGT